MVLVEEVTEDIIIGERESDFETDSEGGDAFASDEEEDEEDDEGGVLDETLAERLAALKDIIPPTTRSSIKATYAAAAGWAAWLATSSGQLAWWATTSALLVGLPLALAIEDEARITQQERELQMQSAGQQQLMGGNAQSPGIVPAGF